MKIAFLDRDGVVNVDHGYVYQIAKFEFTQQFFSACELLRLAGYALVIVTNQSGIARGYYSEDDFSVITDWLRKEFTLHGLTLSAVYYCPHAQDSSCLCRKPMPGMIQQHLKLTNAAPADCIMFGDKPSDEQCSRAAGLGRFFMIDVNKHATHFYDTVHNFVNSVD